MVDHIKPIGAYPDSYMMIRDVGTTVEFWVKANSAATYHPALPFGWTVNGQTGTGTKPYNYPWPGGAWPTPGPLVMLKSFTVLTSQNVTFRLGATGTQALDGPVAFTKYVERTTVRVNVSGTWRQAIPYVKVNGVWKPAQAWIKHSGTWKIGG